MVHQDHAVHTACAKEEESPAAACSVRPSAEMPRGSREFAYIVQPSVRLTHTVNSGTARASNAGWCELVKLLFELTKTTEKNPTLAGKREGKGSKYDVNDSLYDVDTSKSTGLRDNVLSLMQSLSILLWAWRGCSTFRLIARGGRFCFVEFGGWPVALVCMS